MTFKKDVKTLYKMEKETTFDEYQLEHWIECLKASYHNDLVGFSVDHCPYLEYRIDAHDCFETYEFRIKNPLSERNYCEKECRRAVLYRKICVDIHKADIWKKNEMFNYFISKLEKLL